MAQEASVFQSRSTSLIQNTYDVFLSFRDHNLGAGLHRAFTDAGFHLFSSENDEVLRGEDIKRELQKAILESRCSVIVFSKYYASSGRCLDELVMILECKKTSGHVVLPAFYMVEPSQVRNQTGDIGEILARYEKNQPLQKVSGWRAALSELADLGGVMVSPDQHDRYVSKFIHNILRVTEDKLHTKSFSRIVRSDHLIGIHDRVQNINLWLRDESIDFGILAIYGIHGIGKTTIAKLVYNSNFARFERSSFLENIRSNDLVQMQRKLLHDINSLEEVKINSVSEGLIKFENAIRSKRVLLVLDDLDDAEKLGVMLRMKDSFYPGSKIIITTTDVGLLKAHQVHCTVQHVETLNFNESLELFSWHAFGQDHPINDYMELSKRIVQHSGGLPLALKVFGDSLSRKKINVWESALEELETIPNSSIMEVLRTSYDVLDYHDQSLFLHIACFFIGKDKDDIVKILLGCDFYPIIGFQNLKDRCLVTIDADNKVQMHHMIRDMGREIVRLESPDQPGRRSRLWHFKDSFRVLIEKTATEAIEGLVLDMHMNQTNTSSRNSKEVVLETNAFTRMHKLRLLQLSHVQLNGCYEEFPTELIWLCWFEFPLESMPSDFPMENLVVLEMHHSNFKQVWKGTKFLPSLKILDVSHSHGLTDVADLSVVPNLEKLILEDCENLVAVHEPIGKLEKLVYLDMRGCKNLVVLPGSILKLEKLAYLNITGCDNIVKFSEKVPKSFETVIDYTFPTHSGLARERPTLLSRPKSLKSYLKNLKLWSSFGRLNSLKYLDLFNSPITRLPKSIDSLQMLRALSLRGCIKIVELPESIGSLCNLKTFELSDCRSLIKLPTSIGSLPNLHALNLSGCRSLVGLPVSIGSLHNLETLKLSDCMNLNVLPESIGSLSNLQTLKLNGCISLVGLPDSIGSLHKLQTLNLRGCSSIAGLPEGIKELIKLQYLNVSNCPKLNLWPFTDLEKQTQKLVFSERKPPKLLSSETESLLSEPTLEVADSYCVGPVGTIDKDHILCQGSGSSDVNREQVQKAIFEEEEDAKAIFHMDLEENAGYSVQVADEEQLKGLFLYCSLFPSSFEFRKDELVQLWIAEGFIEDNQRTMEETGSEHFHSLEDKGFFVPIDNPSNLLYKVNPVKLSVLETTLSLGTYYKAVHGKLDGASEMTQHLSLIGENIDEMTFGVLKKFKYLRTLLFLSSCGSSIKHIPHDLFLSLKFLRTLNLSQTLISELPNSIRNVTELRYLDVSNTLIKRLPESLDSLLNLQTIRLRGCSELVQLPKNMRKLTNLRHIDLDVTRQMGSMPQHLGNLTKLQTLNEFLVGRIGGYRIGELKNLNDLKGALCISGLENVVSKEEAEEAVLTDKKCLHRLELQWNNLLSENIEEEGKILECLEPHCGLKELHIENYGGSMLPTWISKPSFADLVAITLYKCKNCELLPSIGELPGLKFLSIVEMNKVEEINPQFFRNGAVDYQAFPAFPKLERLEVDTMLSLKEWQEIQISDLQSLVKFTVDSCPELVTLPSLSRLKSLKHLEFRRCPKLLSLGSDGLPDSMESFVIIDCPELKQQCSKEKDQDWNKICHVPYIWFDDEEIQQESGKMEDKQF